MIPDTIFPLQDRHSATRWSRRLAEALKLEMGPAVSQARSYRDSFDWRLFKAGMYLEQYPVEGGALLRLVRREDACAVAELHARGDERFWWDLPESALRERLREILDLRAALPLFTLRLRSQALLKVDGEGKTRARLFVES